MMPRSVPSKLIGLGCILLILAGLIVLLDSAPARAQDTPEAEYVGASECSRCHRDLSRIHTNSAHAKALQDVSRNKGAILADFDQGTTERTVTFPNETDPRPFTKEDVAYVIGAGRYAERYVYRVSRTLYSVFPAQWNIAQKKWEPYLRGEDPWTPESAAYNFAENCAGCHVTDLNVERARWEDPGVQCEMCHGPGSIHVELAEKAPKEPSADELKAMRDAVVVSPDAQVCGQCHSQGDDPASKRPFPTGYKPGGNLLDPALFVLAQPGDQDHWWVSGHGKSANIQYNEWLASAHSKSLDNLKGAGKVDAACLTCHSADAAFIQGQIDSVAAGDRMGEAPAPATVDTAKYGVTCTACHNPHAEITETSPAFNLIAEPYTLCVSCHQDTDVTDGLHHPVQEMFEGITVIAEVPGVTNKHFSEPNGPRCTTCHMPRVPIEGGTISTASHYDQPIFPSVNVEGLTDSCSICHEDVTPQSLQTFINNSQDDTKSRIQVLKNALKTDSPALVRNVISFVETDGSWGVHNHRYTEALLTAAEKAMGISLAPVSSSEVASRPVVNPADCGECHKEEFELWRVSPHATASLNETFKTQFSQQGSPPFCADCHASGFNATTETYVYEGVVCSTCHFTVNNAAHPPAPIQLANKASDCGSCHSGAHAPSYNEWLGSAHNAAKVDCVDCHTPHNNGLKLGDINATCGGCHTEALKDQVHMGKDARSGEDFTCVDCHMKRQTDASGIFVIKTGHTMNVEANVCGDCHGSLHALQKSPTDGLHSPEPASDDLQARVAELETQAQTNWAMGLVGGAIGMLVVIALGVLVARRGKVF